jgi:hypothetical protein
MFHKDYILLCLYRYNVMTIIDVLTSKIKSVQSKLEYYVDGKPTLQMIVGETLKIEREKTKSATIEMDGDFEINSEGRLALKTPGCPIHGNQNITKNGWTKNTLVLINTFATLLYII